MFIDTGRPNGGAWIRAQTDDIRAWRDNWPCSTLRPFYAEFDRSGDLIDLAAWDGKEFDPDGHEFTAFCNDALRERFPAAVRERA